MAKHQYTGEMHAKSLFFGHKRPILVSESTKLHVLHHQMRMNCTVSALSYMYFLYVAWYNAIYLDSETITIPQK